MTLGPLPAAPRRPRFRCTARLSSQGTLLAVVILLLPLALVTSLHLRGVDVFGSEDHSLALDRSMTDGRLGSVRAFAAGPLAAVMSVEFEFTGPDGSAFTGVSFAAPDAGFAPGTTATIEYSTAEPRIARVRGTLRNPFEPWLSRFVGFVVLPGLLALAFAMRDHARRRALLTLGRETPLELLELRKDGRRTILRYRYRDEREEHHTHERRESANSALGRALRDHPAELRVIHDLSSPSLHRLVLATDFVP